MKLCYIIIDGLATNTWETAVNIYQNTPLNMINDTSIKIGTNVDIFSVSRPSHIALSYRLSPFETNLVGNRMVDTEQMKVINPPLDQFINYQSVFDDLKEQDHLLLGFGNKGCGLSEGAITKDALDPGDEGGQRTLQIYMRMTFEDRTEKNASMQYSPFDLIVIPSLVWNRENGKKEEFVELNRRRKEIRKKAFGGTHIGVEKFAEMDDVMAEKVVEFVKTYEPTVVTGTFGGPDKAIHTEGTRHPKAAEVLKNAIDKVFDIVQAMGRDTFFVLTADHGNTDTPHIIPITKIIDKWMTKLNIDSNNYAVATDGRRGFRIWFSEDILNNGKKKVFQILKKLKSMESNRWVHLTPEEEEIQKILGPDIGYDREKFGHIIGAAAENYGYDVTYRKANHGGVTPGCTYIYTFFSIYNGKRLVQPRNLGKIIKTFSHKKNGVALWDINAIALTYMGISLSEYNTPKITVKDYFENLNLT